MPNTLLARTPSPALPPRPFNGGSPGGQERAPHISEVRSDGRVAYAFRTVYPIDLTPANGNFPLHEQFGTSTLAIVSPCRPTQLFFFNIGPGDATLNWMFSEGTSSATPVNASGTSISHLGSTALNYGGSGG